MQRVMDLPGWPPDGGGAYGRGDIFPSSQEVTIKEVFRVMENKITFTCSFGAKDLSYDFSAPDEKTAEKLAVILKANTGKTLF